MISYFKLKAYQPILDAINGAYGSTNKLKGLRILELGPGRRLFFLNYLHKLISDVDLQAVGKTWPPFAQETPFPVYDSYLFPFLKRQRSNTFDIIFSRHVMEQNAFHPLLLMRHPAYKQAIKENRFKSGSADFPSSAANVEAVFKQAYRALKPGGLLISLIAKRKYAVMDPEKLQSLRPQPARIDSYLIGRLSALTVVQK